MRLSRSARNRIARDSRTVTPRGTVGIHTPARPHTMSNGGSLSSPDTGIRVVGYLGHNPTKVHYSGSGADGYKSDWAMQGYDFYTDARWSQTVGNQDSAPAYKAAYKAAHKAGKGKR